MKTMVNKRRFLAALLAAVLVSAALVTSCISPLDENLIKQEEYADDSTPTLVEKGLVRIKVTDSELRTILPTLPAASSLFYSIQFVGGSSSETVPATGTKTYGELNNTPIPLSPDTYTITITASSDSAGTTPVAGWTGSETVSAGASTPITANLHGLLSGTGYFVYNITVPDLPTTGTSWTITSPPLAYTDNSMIIYDSTTSPVGVPIPLNPGPAVSNSGSPLSLSGGYYTVKIKLSAANCQDRIANYVMHIYDTMTSTLTYSIPTINQNKFTVAFDTNGHSNAGGTFTGTQQGNIDFLGTVTDPGTLLNASYDFEGWYPSVDAYGVTSGAKWGFGSSGTKVLKDTTLYANWTPKAPVTITELNIPDITVPVAGEPPVTAITTATQYTGSIVWNSLNPAPANFAAGTGYTAVITLTPASGYTLTGVVQNTFLVSGATSVTHAADTGVITAVFPNTAATITELNIPDITVPVAGEPPVTAITTATQYTGSIVWNSLNPAPANFAAATGYTAVITLTPASGYTLYGVAGNSFTVSGASSVSYTAGTNTVTAVFPTTATTITEFAIPNVTVPVAGAAPVLTIDATQYTGAILWNGSTPLTFAASTAYTATITLTPKTGFTLYGVASNSFTVSGATPVNYTAGTDTVTATFPATGSITTGLTITFTISDASISGAGNPSPASINNIVGGTESLAFTLSGGYTGVTWTMEGVTASDGTNTGLTIDKDSNLLPYLVPGTHRLEVTNGSNTYSAYIDFTVVAN